MNYKLLFSLLAGVSLQAAQESPVTESYQVSKQSLIAAQKALKDQKPLVGQEIGNYVPTVLVSYVTGYVGDGYSIKQLLALGWKPCVTNLDDDDGEDRTCELNCSYAGIDSLEGLPIQTPKPCAQISLKGNKLQQLTAYDVKLLGAQLAVDGEYGCISLHADVPLVMTASPEDVQKVLHWLGLTTNCLSEEDQQKLLVNIQK